MALTGLLFLHPCALSCFAWCVEAPQFCLQGQSDTRRGLLACMMTR